MLKKACVSIQFERGVALKCGWNFCSDQHGVYKAKDIIWSWWLYWCTCMCSIYLNLPTFIRVAVIAVALECVFFSVVRTHSLAHSLAFDISRWWILLCYNCIARVAGELFRCRSNRTLHLISTYVCTLFSLVSWYICFFCLTHSLRNAISLLIVIVILLLYWCSRHTHIDFHIKVNWTKKTVIASICAHFESVSVCCHFVAFVVI